MSLSRYESRPPNTRVVPDDYRTRGERVRPAAPGSGNPLKGDEATVSLVLALTAFSLVAAVASEDVAIDVRMSGSRPGFMDASGNTHMYQLTFLRRDRGGNRRRRRALSDVRGAEPVTASPP